MPPPPLLSRDPGALRLITFPDTTWPSAAARRSASRRPNRPPPTLRSDPGLRREPRRRRRRAGEADGRSGFRLGPQRRTRRRERRGEGEAEEGEATSLPGPYAAHDAGAQRAEDSEEEAVATAPHAHTARASLPPGSARRARARHAGSGGGAGARRGKGRGGWAWPADRPLALEARHHAPRAAPRSGPRRGGSWERGSSLPRYTDTRPARPGKHLTLEGRAVRCKQASNPGPGCPFARGRAHTLALRVHVRLPSPPCTTESENDKRA